MTKAYIFKNGYSFIVESIILNEQEGYSSKHIIEKVPEFAVNASLWFESGAPALNILAVKSSTIEKQVQRKAHSVHTILEANLHNVISFK